MRRVAVIFLILSLTLLSGCSPHRQLERQMIKFTSTELTLPGHLLKLENGKIEDCSWPDSSKVFVKYYSPDECSSCALIHLYEEEIAIISLCDSVGVVPMVIFASIDGGTADFIKTMELYGIDFPLYVDVDGVFDESLQIPSDIRFHHFLIGEDRHPIFVGNPKASRRLEDLFLTACRGH